ncbi:unnamed protein product [Amoebophrya sp. A120]|nr:unnamed protein product [Amoebophrya sp. A120]|eukprot:GSA120T00004556001.1
MMFWTPRVHHPGPTSKSLAVVLLPLFHIHLALLCFCSAVDVDALSGRQEKEFQPEVDHDVSSSRTSSRDDGAGQQQLLHEERKPQGGARDGTVLNTRLRGGFILIRMRTTESQSEQNTGAPRGDVVPTLAQHDTRGVVPAADEPRTTKHGAATSSVLNIFKEQGRTTARRLSPTGEKVDGGSESTKFGDGRPAPRSSISSSGTRTSREAVQPRTGFWHEVVSSFLNKFVDVGHVTGAVAVAAEHMQGWLLENQDYLTGDVDHSGEVDAPLQGVLGDLMKMEDATHGGEKFDMRDHMTSEGYLDPASFHPSTLGTIEELVEHRTHGAHVVHDLKDPKELTGQVGLLLTHSGSTAEESYDRFRTDMQWVWLRHAMAASDMDGKDVLSWDDLAATIPAAVADGKITQEEWPGPKGIWHAVRGRDDPWSLHGVGSWMAGGADQLPDNYITAEDLGRYNFEHDAENAESIGQRVSSWWAVGHEGAEAEHFSVRHQTNFGYAPQPAWVNADSTPKSLQQWLTEHTVTGRTFGTPGVNGGESRAFLDALQETAASSTEISSSSKHVIANLGAEVDSAAEVDAVAEVWKHHVAGDKEAEAEFTKTFQRNWEAILLAKSPREGTEVGWEELQHLAAGFDAGCEEGNDHNHGVDVVCDWEKTPTIFHYAWAGTPETWQRLSEKLDSTTTTDVRATVGMHELSDQSVPSEADPGLVEHYEHYFDPEKDNRPIWEKTKEMAQIVVEDGVSELVRGLPMLAVGAGAGLFHRGQNIIKEKRNRRSTNGTATAKEDEVGAPPRGGRATAELQGSTSSPEQPELRTKNYMQLLRSGGPSFFGNQERHAAGDHERPVVPHSTSPSTSSRRGTTSIDAKGGFLLNSEPDEQVGEARQKGSSSTSRGREQEEGHHRDSSSPLKNDYPERLIPAGRESEADARSVPARGEAQEPGQQLHDHELVETNNAKHVGLPRNSTSRKSDEFSTPA